MKHSWKKLLVIFALLLAFSFAFVSRADFGDFSGDSDFGSYDSGGWDSSDSGWDSDWGDSDWGSTSSGWDSGPVIFYGGGGGAASSMLTLIIGAIILYRILQAMKAQQGSHGQIGCPVSQQTGNRILNDKNSVHDTSSSKGVNNQKISRRRPRRRVRGCGWV